MLAIIGGPHEEVQVALGRAGLGEGGLNGGVFHAAEVHAVAKAKDRPVRLCGADGETDARAPVIAETGKIRGK